MTQAEIEVAKKHERINNLIMEVDLASYGRFFNYESEKNLDDKIRVLEMLKLGKPLEEIPDFEKAFELYPKNWGMWD